MINLEVEGSSVGFTQWLLDQVTLGPFKVYPVIIYPKGYVRSDKVCPRWPDIHWSYKKKKEGGLAMMDPKNIPFQSKSLSSFIMFRGNLVCVTLI